MKTERFYPTILLYDDVIPQFSTTVDMLKDKRYQVSTAVDNLFTGKIGSSLKRGSRLK